MKKSELWRAAMRCVINGDLADGYKVDVLEMLVDEMQLAVFRENEAARKAAATKKSEVKNEELQ